MKRPAGISQDTLNQALNEIARVVGDQWVFTKDEDVMLYRDPYSPLFGEPGELLPYAAIAPDGVEQVQAVVRIANKYGLPLYPISTGKDLGYGLKHDVPGHMAERIVVLFKTVQIKH